MCELLVVRVGRNKLSLHYSNTHTHPVEAAAQMLELEAYDWFVHITARWSSENDECASQLELEVKKKLNIYAIFVLNIRKRWIFQ